MGLRSIASITVLAAEGVLTDNLAVASPPRRDDDQRGAAAPAQPDVDVPPPDDDELQLGGSPHGAAVNAALRGLSRAARSFLLYDPRNDAIRVFLEEYRANIVAALQYGPMELEVRPFELILARSTGGSEVVYLERDRERSLAFRLFRDGVRRVTIQVDVEWDELLRLLEIMSIRYTGVRQQEDDLVTLLFKAAFRGIQVVAVEGFVPDEEQADGAGDDGPRQRADHTIEAPRDWDLPLPELRTPVGYAYKEVKPAWINRLVAECGSQTVAADAIHLCTLVLERVRDPADPMDIDVFVQLASEVRDFLLADDQLDRLVRLVALVQEAYPLSPSRIAPLMLSFTDARALRRILHSVPPSAVEPPESMRILLDLVPADHLTSLIELLAVERGQAARRLMRQLLDRDLVHRWDYAMERLVGAPSDVAADMLRAVAYQVPERVAEAALLVAPRDEPDLNLEILHSLGRSPPGPVRLPLLFALLNSQWLEVRQKAIEQLAEIRTREVYDRLKATMEKGALRIEPREAEALGRAMAKLDPVRAAELADWIKPKGLFNRVVEMPGRQMLQWCAVAAMEGVPGESGDDIDGRLRWLAERAGTEMHQHAMRAALRRRRGGNRG
jgi:hypothetical protein